MRLSDAASTLTLGDSSAGTPLSGVMAKLHEGTLDYSKQRQQFGQPIARFQVLQHRMVDMFMEVEQAKSMTTYATLHLDKPAHERMAAVSQCKAKVSRGAKFVGQNAIQTHGGIGITQELAIGHYFKRLTAIDTLFGDADHHLALLAAEGGLLEAA